MMKPLQTQARMDRRKMTVAEWFYELKPPSEMETLGWGLY